MQRSSKLLLIAIFLFAAFFRLYGLNWDQGQHLHPDERFLTMVANGISWPKDLGEYLDTATSPLNPHNRGFGFFVYGTFPVFLTKWVAESQGQGDYGNLTLVGRELSAIVDLGTVILVFLIGKQISTNQLINKSTNQQIKKKVGYLKLDNWIIGNWSIPLLGMFLYSIMTLPIQLSHFYAVDTYLTFFITLSFYLLIKLLVNHEGKNAIENTTILYSNVVLLGVAFGLALASKISAILFLPIIGLGLLFNLIKRRNLLAFIAHCSLFVVALFITFRLAQPYAFANGNFFNPTPNQKVIENWKQLKSFDNPNSLFPPGVQWITSRAYLFPFKNMILWGLGLPMGIISILAVSYYVLRITYYVFKKKISLILNSKFLILNLSLLWILFLFIYQGSQFVKVMRYFHPIYPFLAIISGYFIVRIFNRFKMSALGYWIIGLLVIIYPISFLSVYSNPHSRVTASEWIYKNIPAGSIISGEQWDDFLPLSLPQPGFTREKYIGIEFTPYAADTASKWTDFAKKLEKTDYIVLTSNRLYGSIMTVPDKYPVTNRYYQALFDGSLGFEKLAEFTSRPNINLPFFNLCLTPPFARYGYTALQSQECTEPGISFVDDYADESFTVYDHPKVIIFKKVKPIEYFSLFSSAHKI